MSLESVMREESTESNDGLPEETRVLVVDNDSTCLAIVSKLLINDGYKAKYADDALSIAEKYKDDLHLVLMEVHLPDMSKYELLEKMAEVSNLPIVIMSSDENENAILGGLFKGAMLYLVKPITMNNIRNLWQFPFMKKVTERRMAAEHRRPESNYRRAKHDREWEEEILDSAVLKRPKLVWTNELHNKFLEAVNDLGIDRAHPKEILHHMNVPGIRKDNISSHLQKYRLSLKRNPSRSRRKVLTDSSKSSLITSYHPPSTPNLPEAGVQSSNQQWRANSEMNITDTFIPIPPLPSEFFDYDNAGEFALIDCFNGGTTYGDNDISPPSPSPPLYQPLKEQEGEDRFQNEEGEMGFPPLVLSPNQDEENKGFEIGSKELDDLYDVFHDEDFGELW